MIIQGTNVPIKVVFDSDVSTLEKLVASLWNKQGKLIKQWEKTDMTILEETVYLPLVEDETRTYPQGKLVLEIKGETTGERTVFWQEIEIEVKARKDRNIDLIDEEGEDNG